MSTICPYCRAAIPADDINVSTDLALCRACGHTSHFSEIVESSKGSGPDLGKPPDGAWFEHREDGFRMGATTRAWMALFLIPFTLVWAGGSLGGIYGSQIRSGRFNLVESLFGIPFLLGSCFLIGACAMSIVGRWDIERHGDELIVFAGIAGLGWKRRYRWSDFTSVREGGPTTRSWGGETQVKLFLEGVRRVSFGTGWSEQRRYFILNAMRQMLREGASGGRRRI